MMKKRNQHTQNRGQRLSDIPSQDVKPCVTRQKMEVVGIEKNIQADGERSNHAPLPARVFWCGENLAAHESRKVLHEAKVFSRRYGQPCRTSAKPAACVSPLLRNLVPRAPARAELRNNQSIPILSTGREPRSHLTFCCGLVPEQFPTSARCPTKLVLAQLTSKYVVFDGHRLLHVLLYGSSKQQLSSAYFSPASLRATVARSVPHSCFSPKALAADSVAKT